MSNDHLRFPVGGTTMFAADGVRSYHEPQWSVSELVAAKAQRRVSVVLPALDEAATVGGVIASIRELGPEGAGLVDEIVCVDSGSQDDTRERAVAAGAKAIGVAEILPELPALAPRPGKGEALWRSLAVTTGEIVAFVDSDLYDPSPSFVPGILGPLLLNPDIVLVKAQYRRPYRGPEEAAVTPDPYGGGRVTELVARPLLAALAPELAGLRQPLAGEYAVRRDFAESVPFAAEYGVEIGLVLDAAARYGPNAIAQVGLGERAHRHRDLDALAQTARQVMETAYRRLGIAVPAPCLPADRPPMSEVYRWSGRGADPSRIPSA